VGYVSAVAGQVISSATYNAQVRDQVVSVFATASARDSAITSPVAGMYCTTTDTGYLWRYNGTKWLIQPTVLLKQGDQTWTSNTGNNNDDTLFFSVSASCTYAFDMSLGWIASTTPQIKFGISAPAGYRLDYGRTGKDNTGATFADYVQNNTTLAFSNCGSISAGNYGDLRLTGMITIGGTGGTFQLVHGQVNSSATSVAVLRGSQMTFEQIG
jgi:hypothetical protein